MADVERRQKDESAYRDHLQRSERVWNRWSDWYRLSEQDFEPIRDELIDHLGLKADDRVLEIGCGPGVNFGLIREAIGDEGHLVAVDYSPKMVAKAKERISTNEWENIEVVRADATTADLGDCYDAAVSTLALSVMPDIKRVVQNVYSGLKPNSPFGVLDIRAFPSGTRQVLNPLLRRFLRWYANWNPTEDVPAVIDEVFGGYEQLGTYMLGTVYTIKATRPP